ncbi:MAG: hypothetical protein ACFFER_15550 [Candidatus Thorarchaeota archaeon]
MTIIFGASPLDILLTVPIYIAVRFLPDNKRRRIKGCIVAFLIWLFVSMGIFNPRITVISPGTIELFIIILLMMLADIGMQFRSLTEESSI